MENLNSLDRIDAGRLKSVAAIAAVEVVKGISVELHSIEFREAGGRLVLRVEDLRTSAHRADSVRKT